MRKTALSLGQRVRVARRLVDQIAGDYYRANAERGYYASLVSREFEVDDLSSASYLVRLLEALMRLGLTKADLDNLLLTQAQVEASQIGEARGIPANRWAGIITPAEVALTDLMILQERSSI